MSNNLAPREDCPSGENCPIHFRVDKEIQDAGSRLYGAVTYVGEYCVMTGDHPDVVAAFSDPLIMMSQLIRASQGDPTPFYQTVVLWVGEKGCVYDVSANVDTYNDSMVTKKDTRDYKDVQKAHQDMVQSMRVLDEP